MPDFANFDGTPNQMNGHDVFRYDARRVAMNVSMDYNWFKKDEWQVTWADSLLEFFYREGIYRYGNQYTLDGTRLDSWHSTGLVAMNACAVLASDSALGPKYIPRPDDCVWRE